MRLFDGYVAVDWSASGIPKRGKDSIWIAIRGWSGTEEPENPEPCAKAVVRIETLLESATLAGRRLLCGFDFPFGYPVRTARTLTEVTCYSIAGLAGLGVAERDRDSMR